MPGRDLTAFLADDFDRLFAAQPTLYARARGIDGQRLFLAGATGFFGKNLLGLLSHLHRNGCRFEVGAMSRDPQGFYTANAWAEALHWLDLRSGDAREPWLADGEYALLLHAATDTRGQAHRDLQALFDDMQAVTRQALTFAGRHGTRRLLLCGSGAQYGDSCATQRVGTPDDSLQACVAGLPGSAYGEGKRVAELLASLHVQRRGGAAVFTRCFAFVGAGLPLNEHFAIGNFIRDAIAGLPVQLQSAGTAVRSYLYGADLAVWLLLLLLEADNGSTVNVGSDEGLSIGTLAQRVSAVLAPGLSVQLGPARPGELRPHYLPDISGAKRLGLGVWTPLDLAIRRTAQWNGWV